MNQKLFTPFRLRELEFKNRIFVSPMCQYSAVNGVLQPWHMVHLGSRAVGGAGLVMVEATAVSAVGRISYGDSGLWNEEQMNALVPIVRFLRENGSIPAIQLAHAGRKGSTPPPFAEGHTLKPEQRWTPIAPSPVAFDESYPHPAEMTAQDIEDVSSQFVTSTKLAQRAGFQVVELHAAHGYLMHEFLSPLCNFRKDEHGGSLENRMRFPLRVAKAMREVWPHDLPMFVRVSATDWAEKGWDLEQTVVFARELKKLGIDLIDCSTGGAVPHAKIPVTPNYQVPFAEGVKTQAQIATGAVGMITDPHQADQILQDNKADVVFLARKLLNDPYWPLHAAKTLGVDVSWPAQYGRAKNY